MRPSDIEILHCPRCHGSLTLTTLDVENGNVVNGVLRCPACSKSYPILNHVCIFLTDAERDALLSPEEKRLAAALCPGGEGLEGLPLDPRHTHAGRNWAYQFADAFPVDRRLLENIDGFWGETAFFKFCGLDKGAMADKTLAVFCGGTGREAWHLCRTGAQRIIVLDLGGHIGCLPALLAEHLDKLVLIRCDVMRHPIKSGTCAVAICDHALQHIPDYAGAYRAMAETTVSGGLISICVYSFENNWPMTHVVEPAKRVLHLLPVHALRVLALVPAGLIWLYQTVLCGSVGLFFPRLSAKLPWNQLFSLWLRDGFGKIWEACFDLLHAPVSYHFNQTEVTNLATDTGLRIQSLEMVNKTMWTMVAEKV